MGSLGKELKKAASEAKIKDISDKENRITLLKESIESDKVSNDSILMNHTRQTMLEYLCRYPCSYLSTISRDLNISTVTATWHLKKLINGNFISKKKLKGITVYYPKGMIRYTDIGTLALLNTHSIKFVFSLIIRNPGITQKELSSLSKSVYQTIISHTNRMEKADLIYSIKDGIYKRYYPTEEIKELEDYYKKVEKRFESNLINKMRKDGIKPKIISKRKGKGNIEINSGLKTENIKIFFAPDLPT